MDGVVALPHVLVYILMAACGVIIPNLIGKTIPDIYILKKVLEMGNLQLSSESMAMLEQITKEGNIICVHIRYGVEMKINCVL
jgi:hypothetical protein